MCIVQLYAIMKMCKIVPSFRCKKQTENRVAYDLSRELDEGILAVFLPNWSFVLVGLLVMEERGVVSLEQSKARSFVNGGVPESVFTRGPIGPGDARIDSLGVFNQKSAGFIDLQQSAFWGL